MSYNAFQSRGTASQPTRLMIADAESKDDAQASGKWLSVTVADTMEIQQ